MYAGHATCTNMVHWHANLCVQQKLISSICAECIITWRETYMYGKPTHIYDPTSGRLDHMRRPRRLTSTVAGYYLRSERSPSGHEICVFSRTSRKPHPYRPQTHTCRFRFDTGRRIRWMTDGEPDVDPVPKRRKEAFRVRILVPEDIAQWIYATHGTPRTWLDIVLTAFGSDPHSDESYIANKHIDVAPRTYDARTMYSMAQGAGRYVTSTQCVPHRRERTIGARNGFYRDTPYHLGTLEGLQFVRAHKHKFPGRPIPLSAALPHNILLLPRPKRALHIPSDRPMRTLATSLPGPIRSPLEWAIHTWTNDTLDRWLSYLLMWAHSPTNETPTRVACRLAGVLAGVPWIRLFRTAEPKHGFLDPFQLVPGRDETLWDAILRPSERTYVP